MPGRATRMQAAFLPFRVVSEYSRLVVFRLGRMTGVKGPGIVGVLPIADRFIRVDLREFFLEIPRQTAITKDNAPISIDFITFFKVVDVQASAVRPTPDLGCRAATDHIRGLVPVNERMVVLLDLDRLIGAEMIEALGSVPAEPAAAACAA